MDNLTRIYANTYKCVSKRCGKGGIRKSMYEEAVDEMLQRTSTTYASQTIVGSNDKSYSRVRVLQVVVETPGRELKVK